MGGISFCYFWVQEVFVIDIVFGFLDARRISCPAGFLFPGEFCIFDFFCSFFFTFVFHFSQNLPSSGRFCVLIIVHYIWASQAISFLPRISMRGFFI